MMKSLPQVLIVAILCLPVYGGILDDNKISAGEYIGSVAWRSYDPPLIVDGGGALLIEVGDNGRLIVESTSTPLSNLPPRRGVYDIYLFDNAHLEYKNGVTALIDVGENVKAELKGGSINYIRSMKHTQNGTDQNVGIYALPGWSYISNNPLLGIQGNWLANSLPFRIEFINDSDYDPAWMNVNVITPEPTTLVLLAAGGLLIHRKRM